MNHQLPQFPDFLKPTTAVIAPEDNIIYPAMSQRVDYEGDWASSSAKKPAVCPAGSAGIRFGYTCFNDVTARDLQQRDGQWTRAKVLIPLLLSAPDQDGAGPVRCPHRKPISTGN